MAASPSLDEIRLALRQRLGRGAQGREELLAAADLTAAFEGAVAAGVRTRDLGGTASTEEMSRAVLARLEA